MNQPAMTAGISLSADAATQFAARLFEAAGLSRDASMEMGRALVEAEMAGLPSHGLSQAEMYIRRLLLGSVSPAQDAIVVEDRDAIAVLDAERMFGHLVGRQAMDMAIDRSKRFGHGMVAVRNSFHFGTAGRYAQQASDRNCIGMAMCNTKPMMPAPGGLERLVGNNPVSIGMPSGGGPDFLLDMALSEAALGKIRVAEKEGRTIPPTWAVDKDGRPTTDPKAAIEGMLLPAGGAKGFALAFAVDLMCSLLSMGPGGDEVPPLYGDLSKPFVCSLLFLAIDIEHFRPAEDFRSAAAAGLARIRNSRSGEGRLRTPGERSHTLRKAGGGKIQIPRNLLESLDRLAGELGVDELIH